MRIWHKFFLLLSLFLGACTAEGPAEPKVTQHSVFRTTAPSQLYFKNIRSTAYYVDRKPQSKKDIYRLRAFSNTRKRPILVPLIVQNWLEDEAYLFLEPNDYEYGFADSLLLRWTEAGDTTQYYMPFRGKEEELKMAEKIFGALAENRKLEVKTRENGWQPIFQEGDDRRHFLITLGDYFRLVER